ncbi:Cyclin-L1-1 [Vitis vinifera]|uniref:Cyclin-L1-1 n=1 Tax=Vitis vinifera TaxID=29760 RepID=A0A438JRV8_VITVI|nr:Cyclin-L1-1 [Vitis vinifera]
MVAISSKKAAFVETTSSSNGHWPGFVPSLLLQEVICPFQCEASKLEESPRKARQVLIVFHRMECRRENLPVVHLDPFSKKYAELKTDLSRTERHILKEMGFICHVEHPHKFISNYLATLKTPPELRQEAWNLANDSTFTAECGAIPLCDSFPTLYALAVSKDVWSFSDGGGIWSLLFFRPFNGWEVDEVESFLLCLNGKIVQRDKEDRVLWTETKSDKFLVKSLYKALESSSPDSFP